MSKTPTTLIIMDGFGLRDAAMGNAIKGARTPSNGAPPTTRTAA